MVLYLILNYLGFPIGTVVGSLSITTLALSLGAKDLTADILAGLSIVFERTFKVGDIVEIHGNRGLVQEIGVRSTKLIILPDNNVLSISNHEIGDVLNLTQKLSMHTVELRKYRTIMVVSWRVNCSTGDLADFAGYLDW